MKCPDCGHEINTQELEEIIAEVERANKEILANLRREETLAWQGLCESGQGACVDPED